jgi:hypothetical protein
VKPQDLEAMVEAAKAELRIKSHADIEKSTAYIWAARAIAASDRYQSSGVPEWLFDIERYRDEACEHAALADTTGETLLEIRAWMRRRIVSDAFERM